MKALLALVVAVIAGVVGLLAAGLVAAAYADWYHVSTFEGGAAFMVLGVALVGGLVSMVLGLVTALLVATPERSGFWKSVGLSCGGIIGLGALVALVLYLLADFPPTINGEELRLEVEIKLPAGESLPPDASGIETSFVLGSVVDNTRRASRDGELKTGQAREENGRWIIPAEVLLFTTRGLRAIEATIGDRTVAAFLVPLPPRPGSEFEQWSDWSPRPPAGSPPWPDTKSSYRFRVQRIPPPPPPPTEEEAQAAREAEEQSTFDAIPPDAPISAWLPYTPFWQNKQRRAAAIARITGRPDYATGLGALMLDADARQAESALRFVGEMPAPDRALIPPVAAAGRDIIGRMKAVNATTPEQDPGYEGFADVSIRFSAWIIAVGALREKAGGDFVPELREMLELSRVRPDSHAMTQDIRRVAGYYMKTWTGVEPLPGDPPPR